jgi:hypothetical protein
VDVAPAEESVWLLEHAGEEEQDEPKDDDANDDETPGLPSRTDVILILVRAPIPKVRVIRVGRGGTDWRWHGTKCR